MASTTVMYKILFCVCSCISARSIAHAQTNTTCRDVSDEVDLLLGDSDYLMFNDMVKPQISGFQQVFHLSLLGVPVTQISLEVENGSLTGLDSLSRSDYASSECWTKQKRTLQGVFQYNTLTLKYDFVKTGFWLWEVTGSLAYQILPTVSMKITKGADDCRWETFFFTNPDEIGYEVSIDESSWKGWIWIANKVLRSVLARDGRETPLLPSILEASRGVVESYFKRIWCDHSNPYP